MPGTMLWIRMIFENFVRNCLHNVVLCDMIILQKGVNFHGYEFG